ncbi:hypothetical protein [Ekhidna sp.]
MLVDPVFENYLGNKKLDFSTNLQGITHLDLNRQIESGLDVQFFSVWCPGSQVDPYKMAMLEIDSLESIVSRNADRMILARNSEEVNSALALLDS